MLKSHEKVIVSKGRVQQFEELNKALDKCCGLALQQPLPSMQIALMTDASFADAGYAFLIEYDPNQKVTSLRKSYAPPPMVQKPSSQLKSRCPYMQKTFLQFTSLSNNLDTFSGARRNKNRTAALWNACDNVIQFNFVKTHNPGAQNTAADFLSRLEADPKDKLFMKIREDVQTIPIEYSVQSAGVSQEEQIFYATDEEETEEQYWARKEAIRQNPVTAEIAITIQSVSFYKIGKTAT